MRIQLKQLSIVNFKGISNLQVKYNHITSIWGDNATGKTTIFDAFLWLFFGKNSEGVSQFEVKRLDENNKFIKGLESEVEAILLIDTREICIKKVLRQKWITRRGDIESNYNGDENIYYWNDVPLKETEFKTKVKEIIDENLFRLITNPFYFSSLKWQERRNTLIDIAGNITNEEVMKIIGTNSHHTQYSALLTALNQNKTVDEYKREIASKKKKIKDEVDYIPSRIDEVRRGLPTDIDFEQIKADILILNQQLADIEANLNDRLAIEKGENEKRANLMKEYNQLVQDRQQKIFSIKSQMQNIEFEAKQKAKESSGQLEAEKRSLQSKIADKEAEVVRFDQSITQLIQQKTSDESAIEKLREDYIRIDSEKLKFDDHSFNCPTCQQALPAGDVEAKRKELTENFNSDKLQKLSKLSISAGEYKKAIEAIEIRINNGTIALKNTQGEVEYLKQQLTDLEVKASFEPSQSIEDKTKEILSINGEYLSLATALKNAEALDIPKPVFEATESTVHEDLINQRQTIQQRVIDLNKELAKEQQIETGKIRIDELQSQETKLIQEIADLEGIEWAIMQFSKAKVDAIERRINGKFKFVKFKMFDTQVNGAEVECCETLVNTNGSFVPFSDANNAARINSGIDIINALCEHYDIYAPIFIDNAESVTKISETDSQIIAMYVSGADKKLRVA